LEEKIKRFNENQRQGEEMDQMRTKVRNLHIENETLRTTF
jgi:hypothetical protein